MCVWCCILAVPSGTLVTLLAGINAQLRVRLDSSYYATLLSIIVSLASITLFCLIARLPLPSVAPAAKAPWWVWTGGIVGVAYVFMAIDVQARRIFAIDPERLRHHVQELFFVLVPTDCDTKDA